MMQSAHTSHTDLSAVPTVHDHTVVSKPIAGAASQRGTTAKYLIKFDHINQIKT